MYSTTSKLLSDPRPLHNASCKIVTVTTPDIADANRTHEAMADSLTGFQVNSVTTAASGGPSRQRVREAEHEQALVAVRHSLESSAKY